MSKCQIITRRLNKRVKPIDVLKAIETLTEKYSICWGRYLWEFSATTVNIASETKPKTNPILRICKKYPELEPYLLHEKEGSDTEISLDDYCIRNFDNESFSINSNVPFSLVREVISKIPSTYSCNELTLILDSVDFLNDKKSNSDIRKTASGFGLPNGSYIIYTRSFHGNEKHTYVHIAVEYEDGADLDKYRNFHFDFADLVPSVYEGTELRNC